MKRVYFAIGTAALALLAFGLSIFLLLNGAREHIARAHAERTALTWAEYIGANLSRIEPIASGAPLTPDEEQILIRVRKLGGIFRLSIFDKAGHLRLVSDDLGPSDHNPTAAAVAAKGVPYTSVVDRDATPRRPAIYAESYVPVMRDGKTVAVVAICLDETSSASILRRGVVAYALKIVALTALVLALPGLGLMLFARRRRRQNLELESGRNRTREADRVNSEILADGGRDPNEWRPRDGRTSARHQSER